MTCNLCLPPCECGAEEAAGRRLLEHSKKLQRTWAAYMAEPEPQWPELEAMEAALANYAEAA